MCEGLGCVGGDTVYVGVSGLWIGRVCEGVWVGGWSGRITDCD